MLQLGTKQSQHASWNKGGLCCRTKATLIYRKTKNLRAGQQLLGHAGLESNVRYLEIDEQHALEISEQIEICAVVGGRAVRLPQYL